jgi:AraC-like DNA-binding protein
VEIGRRCIFTNESQFSKTFKSICGSTPREFRTRQLGANSVSLFEMSKKAKRVNNVNAMKFVGKK